MAKPLPKDHIPSVKDAIKILRQHGLFVQAELFTTKSGEHTKVKVSDPDEGASRFHVCCSKLSIYTCIGADNRHHASNKATKLFGPHWSSLSTDAYLLRGYEYHDVASFGRLIRTL